MPDWSYHPLFKPFLHRLPPKVGRTLILGALGAFAKLPFGTSLVKFLGHMEPPAEIETHISKLRLQSPVALSGWVDPDLLAVYPMQYFGFGLMEIGPVTLKPIAEGGIRRDMDNNPLESETPDSSRGLEHVHRRLSQIPKKTAWGLRVRFTGDIHEMQVIIDRFLGLADLFFIEGIGEGKELVWSKLRETYPAVPLYVTLPSREGNVHFLETIQPDGIVIDEPKTMRRADPTTLRTIQTIRKQNSTLPIIASAGITDPADALELLDAGANVVMIHNGLLYSGPGLAKRINEALLARIRPREIAPWTEWMGFFLMGLGVWIAGVIATVFALTSVILPYDEAFLGMTRDQLQRQHPQLLSFMSHDRNSLAGVMLSAGFLYMMLAYHGVRRRYHWARKTYMIAATMGFLNFFYFMGFGYFDILHLVYNALLLPFFVYGIKQSRYMKKGQRSINVRNHRAWRYSQAGQLCFVVMGIALLLGGAVISFIGMTTIFVPEDLSYLHLIPYEINTINPNLLPLIAHDRAGFGGALLCEGMLLLCISLWGFGEGQKWVWWTLLWGGLPGFLGGIGTHLHIGYTDLFHLSPAYFLLVLYLVGLLFSYRFLMLPENT